MEEMKVAVPQRFNFKIQTNQCRLSLYLLCSCQLRQCTNHTVTRRLYPVLQFIDSTFKSHSLSSAFRREESYEEIEVLDLGVPILSSSLTERRR